jgi:hypothetical protein
MIKLLSDFSVNGSLKVIDPLRVDAVFTKQRSQISARRSGGLFVDGDLSFCHSSIFVV